MHKLIHYRAHTHSNQQALTTANSVLVTSMEPSLQYSLQRLGYLA